MIIDCSMRNFKHPSEKIIWIIVIVIGGVLGALVYLFLIKLFKPRGLMKH